MMFPAYFLASNLLARSSLVSIDGRLILAALVTILVFLQIPLAAAVLNRVDLPSGFQLAGRAAGLHRGRRARDFAVALRARERSCCSIAGNSIDVRPADARGGRQLVDKIRDVSPILVVALAVVPAVCEEFFFRGYLLAAFGAVDVRHAGRGPVGILFGLFHLVAIEQLHFERLVPSTCLGLVLGWVCLRSGSALPGMLLHASHNAFLLMAAYYQRAAGGLGLGPRPIRQRGHGFPPGQLARHGDNRRGDRCRAYPPDHASRPKRAAGVSRSVLIFF